MNLNLLAKCALAFISGVACWWLEFDAHMGRSSTVLSDLGALGMFGFLFALGVLFPYLRRDRWLPWRGAALVAVSAISYWCAMNFLSELRPSGSFRPGDFILASLVGALIVLLGAKLVIPLNHPRQLAVNGFVAAVLGGLLFSATNLWGGGGDSFVLAYGAWHLLMAAAIHFSELRDWKARKAI